MKLNKVGSPIKLQLVKKGAMSFDPNLFVKKIVETWGRKPITIDQIHEAAKAMGIIDYNSEDMDNIVHLLESSGIDVKNG